MKKIYKIGIFEFDAQNDTLISDNSNVKLEPLTSKFLCFLIQHQGEILSREQLLTSVWQNRVVSDDSIRKVVKKLRQALNDDARQPRYIKTVSMQGYSLIANVSSIEEVTEKSKTDLLQKSSYTSTVSTKLWGLLFFCLFVVISIWQYIDWSNSNNVQSSQAQNIEAEQYPKIEKLTLLSGSEMYGDFNDKNKQLVFSHRENNNEAWHLYTKTISNGEVKRLTWDGGNYRQAMFSPDGQKISYIRTDKNGTETWLAGYDQKRGLIEPVMLTEGHFAKEILSWSSDGKSIYSYGREQASYPFSIYSLNIINRKRQQVTFPNVQALGDIEAKESPDGKYLAVIRSTGDSRFSLMIMDLLNQDLVVDQTMNFNATYITWQDDSQSLAISSFEGDFYTFSLDNEQIIEKAGCNPGLNDVFHSCGLDCFFMRSHHMNYTDIKEIPNPFEPIAQQSTLHLEASKAELNPIYNQTGDTIYFSSIDKDKARIFRRKLGSGHEELATFGSRRKISNLSLNKAETYLLGKLQGRVFTLELKSKKVKFITSALDNVDYPTWQDNKTIMFSRRLTVGASILSYDLLNDISQPFKSGLIIQRQLNDGRIFVVDETGILYKLNSDNSQHEIIQLPNVNTDNWKIQGNYLYFTEISGQDVVMTRHHLLTNQQEIRVVAQNGFRLNFDIHPNSEKFLITQQLLADSNLVKVHWSPTISKK